MLRHKFVIKLAIKIQVTIKDSILRGIILKAKKKKKGPQNVEKPGKPVVNKLLKAIPALSIFPFQHQRFAKFFNDIPFSSIDSTTPPSSKIKEQSFKYQESKISIFSIILALSLSQKEILRKEAITF